MKSLPSALVSHRGNTKLYVFGCFIEVLATQNCYLNKWIVWALFEIVKQPGHFRHMINILQIYTRKLSFVQISKN